MAARKAYAELKPAQQARIARAAEQLGVSVEAVRSSPELAKRARGHAQSESHPERLSTFQEGKGSNRDTFRAGRSGAKGEPTLKSIRQSLGATQGDTVMFSIEGQFDRYGRQGSKFMASVVDRESAFEILADRRMDYHAKIATLLGSTPDDPIHIEAVYVGEARGEA